MQNVFGKSSGLFGIEKLRQGSFYTSFPGTELTRCHIVRLPWGEGSRVFVKSSVFGGAKGFPVFSVLLVAESL